MIPSISSASGLPADHVTPRDRSLGSFVHCLRFQICQAVDIVSENDNYRANIYT